MSKHVPAEILQLGPADVAQFEAMMTVFGEAFEDVATYCEHRPSRAYVKELLASPFFIAIAAFDQETVVGGLAA